MSVRTEGVMGTVVSIDVRQPIPDPSALDETLAGLHVADARFSPYRPDSEISRIADGHLDEGRAHPDVQTILSLAEGIAIDSDGAFDVRRWRSDGRLDPSGIVKGWAIEGAASRIAAGGGAIFAIGAGGDIVVRGGASLPGGWRIGIRHPDRPDRVAKVVALHDGAIATSGAYERGAHIRDPRDGRVAGGVRSMTVVGPSLTLADAYATGAYVMGLDGLDWVAGHDGFVALAISWDDRVRWTPGMDAYLRN